MGATLSIAVIGAGMGGLTAAALLHRAGFEVNLYEQADKFSRIGAGIQMSPNAMKVLRKMDLEPSLRDIAFQPEYQLSREWDTGNLNLKFPMGRTLEERHGAPFLMMHRGDLHAQLTSAVPDSLVHRSKRLVGFEQTPSKVHMQFADGTVAEADMMIAADGVHSSVRDKLFGPSHPHYSGRVAHRTTFPAALLNGDTIADCTKWWGPDRHIVIYYTTRARDEIYFVTSVPEQAWSVESWSLKADMDELRQAFAGFHPEVRKVLEACPEANKWPIYERDPMPEWSRGRVLLIGDACHPMTPYMAQGAATSMEDAAVLTRCLAGCSSDEVPEVARRFVALRSARTALIQETSHSNTWLHRKADTDWVYGYDAWTLPLDSNVEQGVTA